MIETFGIDALWSDSQISADYVATLRRLCQWTGETASADSALSRLPSIFCEAYGGDLKQTAPIVTIWNVLRHAARLLDDVEDNHQALSGQTAVTLNVSTGLIFTASYLLGELESHTIPSETAQEIRREFHVALLQICGGQHDDLSIRMPSLDQSWEIARNKTAVGLGLVCWAGSRIATSDRQELKLCRQFGCTLGLLDQIHDDLTDLTAEQDLDISSGHGLPIAYALTVLPATQQDELLSLLKSTEPAKKETARRLILQSGAAVYLATQAMLHRDQAMQILARMTIPTETNKTLQQMVNQYNLTQHHP